MTEVRKQGKRHCHEPNINFYENPSFHSLFLTHKCDGITCWPFLREETGLKCEEETKLISKSR
jgi:hypothetical protein